MADKERIFSGIQRWECLKHPGVGYVISVVSSLSSLYAARGELSRMPTMVKIG